METHEQDVERIRTLQEDWMRAWLERDAARLEALLAPDYALVVSAMPDRRMDRAAWLKAALGAYRGTAFDYRDMQVRVLGDIAIASSIARQHATVGGEDRSGEFFLTDVWRRRGDSWQVVARYSSRPETASASSDAVARAG